MPSPFQSSVLRKHLTALNGLACHQAYARLQAHFGERGMQERVLAIDLKFFREFRLFIAIGQVSLSAKPERHSIRVTKDRMRVLAQELPPH